MVYHEGWGLCRAGVMEFRMKSSIIHVILTFLIVNIVMLTGLMTGCGGDEALEEDSPNLSGEMSGGDKADTDRL